MMNPFAAIEAAVTSVTAAVFSNATATISGQGVDGTFDAEYQEILGASVSTPAFLAPAAALANVTPGTALTITCSSYGMTNVAYTVAELQRGHGATRLMLRKA